MFLYIYVSDGKMHGFFCDDNGNNIEDGPLSDGIDWSGGLVLEMRDNMQITKDWRGNTDGDDIPGAHRVGSVVIV